MNIPPILSFIPMQLYSICYHNRNFFPEPSSIPLGNKGSGKTLSSIGTLKVLTMCTSDCFRLRTSDFMVPSSSV